MCGLAGFIREFSRAEDLRSFSGRMAEAISHRGPDDCGVWVDSDAGIALAHRRLSILDLSTAGHQPMSSEGGRWIIAYNGEIYNHLEMRRALESADTAPVWRGHSDTETLLACIEAWGVEGTLERSVGMFAIALWDRERRELWLARDRLGEKPLYYGWQGDAFLFGSELKALRAHPAFNAVVDRGALSLFLRHNYVPEPYSIWQGIHKLPPGTWIKTRLGERNAQPVEYWSLAEVAEQGAASSFQGSDVEALDALERLLGNALQGQIVADVPVGALLSGGIDSTLITALMQTHSSRPVRTFTIGFDEKEYDEAVHARAVAAHLGTDHTELRLSPREALDLIPRLPDIYDEPFADSSQMPTHLVMKLARQHVTVALSGDAGDELFGGYNRYTFLPKVWSAFGRVPAPFRSAGLGLAACMPGLIGSITGASHVGNKIGKVRRVFDGPARNIDDLYVTLVGEWEDPARMVIGGVMPPNLLDDRTRWPRLGSPVARMMALDAITYLPGDILTKVDRAAMAVSLETRAPFLDRNVVEFAWTLPMHMKLRDGKGKWLLRQLLDRHVPRALIERPKQGFGIPLDDWLRGPLREWADTLLSEARLRGEGYLDPIPIRRTWERHLRGEVSAGYRLWSVLMFQAWLESQQGMHL
ncbi:asparagine synthase (glutamine-hydrolyzing) [Thermomonas sp.]|jgi:asparagine synthase (glutamine-hydrolysing)|uniref:asparagine synthase (glutamine-hydrolyzing) n=1 Tax=Thermomonas sp. TaxID=1971895 RepID=UPI0025795208|nr:asparagine synthase (glutamine-hydrolyzing) [Thermomonas sp.]